VDRNGVADGLLIDSGGGLMYISWREDESIKMRGLQAARSKPLLVIRDLRLRRWPDTFSNGQTARVRNHFAHPGLGVFQPRCADRLADVAVACEVRQESHLQVELKPCHHAALGARRHVQVAPRRGIVHSVGEIMYVDRQAGAAVDLPIAD